MQPQRFRAPHITPFLLLAAAEGWICDAWEMELLLTASSGGCFTVEAEGEPAAFVTSVSWGKSGWIGNLLVRPDCRGRGVGNSLMRLALGRLRERGVRTVWLTASAAGEPIYRRLGFAAAGEIRRWRGSGSGSGPSPLEGGGDIRSLDASCWGESRDFLLERLSRDALLCASPLGFLFLRPLGEGYHLGPWTAEAPQEAAALLRQGLERVPAGAPVLLDAPAANPAVAPLLEGAGFSAGGATTLMHAGPALLDPHRLFALGSLGSMA